MADLPPRVTQEQWDALDAVGEQLIAARLSRIQRMKRWTAQPGENSMQLSIHIELYDQADDIEIANTLFQVGLRASNIATAGKPMTVDEERHIDVHDLPAVWNASIFRPR